MYSTFILIIMKNYIVMDLEWNQGSPLTENPNIPFEIVEIGAVKLDENKKILDTFDSYVRPQVYHKMNVMTQKVIHLDIEDLAKAEIFPIVMRKFLKWCGDDYIFCTWGNLDLVELQTNMRYYGLEPFSNGPLKYLDIQKLFSIVYSDGKTRRSLETAVDFMHIEKNDIFHQADSDAYYTALIMQKMARPDVESYYSLDVFHLPADSEHEVHAKFDTYSKYISRRFENKAEAMKDAEVYSFRCFECGKKIKKQMQWFSLNSKNYYCAGKCEEHGAMRGKLRVKKSEDGGVYIVKTIRSASKEDIEELVKKERKSKVQAAKLAAIEQRMRRNRNAGTARKLFKK